MHVATLHLWLLLNRSVGFEVFGETLEHGQALLRMGHLTTTEHNRDLDACALLEEAHDVALFGLVVARVNLGAELHLLDLDLGLVFLSGLGLHSLLVLVLTKVHDFANRRLSVGANLDKIKTLLISDTLCVAHAKNTQLGTVNANQAAGTGGNLLVNARTIRLGYVKHHPLMRYALVRLPQTVARKQKTGAATHSSGKIQTRPTAAKPRGDNLSNQAATVWRHSGGARSSNPLHVHELALARGESMARLGAACKENLQKAAIRGKLVNMAKDWRHKRGAGSGSHGAAGRGGSGGAAERDGSRGGRNARSQAPAEPQVLDEATGLPQHLIDTIHAVYGEDDVERIVVGWQARGSAERRVTLRANTLKATREDVAAALDAAGITHEPVSWYADAFVLGAATNERDLWSLDIYRAGGIYLQSLSSMLPPLVLAPEPGADILDMCAAPGGKTSQMAALGQGAKGIRAAHITACELNAPRAEKLEHNLGKMGAINVNVMRTDARKLDSWFSFDQILLDAPCTGSGTVHTHDEHAARNLTPALAERVERNQTALIEKALEILKPGGTLVYSTCSLLPRENENIVSAALTKHPDCELVPVELSAEVPLLPNKLEGTATVCPTALYEGFFVAKIKKN